MNVITKQFEDVNPASKNVAFVERDGWRGYESSKI